MGKFLSVLLLTVAVFVCLVESTSGAPLGPVHLSQAPENPLKVPVYIYQQQGMEWANWLYIGFVPRMEDPSRIHIYLSQRGYTMRAEARFTREEIANYPRYLVQRAEQVKLIAKEENIEIFQTKRYEKYLETVERIRASHDTSPGFSEEKYRKGLELLTYFFPENVFVQQSAPTVETVVLHMVYPLTLNAANRDPAPTGDYQIYLPVEERRSRHCDKKAFDPNLRKVVCVKINQIFSGFPAFWLSDVGAGIGVHGPIRYSRSHKEKDTPKGYKTQREFWDDNNFLGEDYGPTDELDPRFRWDLVRTNNSKGCFRSENTLELRQLLPSDAKVVEDVWWSVFNDYDYVTVDPTIGRQVVDVNYYVVSPYAKFDKEQWLRTHFLSAEEKKSKDFMKILEERMAQTRTFPYLNPYALEFKGYSENTNAPAMRRFNRIPYGL